MSLIGFIVLYLLGTIALGIYAGTRVKTSKDYALAGRSLPLVMIITTTFATWFGSETVLGISSKFVEGGLNSVVEDPFGASMCLVLVGAFFARKLYRGNFLTIGDFYRERYGQGVEMFCSVAIIISYLGWVAAQITAIGLVFNIVTDGALSVEWGMVVGTASVLIYVVLGGMLAVAWTDFVQMIVLVIGLVVIAWLAGDMAGGPDNVLALARERDWFRFWPEPSFNEIVFFIGAAVTMMLGSIPQQDVFQRVMAAKDAKTAVRGPIIGGLCYLAFAFVPMFIVACAVIIMPDQVKEFLDSEDAKQRILPMLVLTHMPFAAKVIFFGALLSAIKSTSSATLLAPSTSFVENIYKRLRPGMNDRQELRAFRITLVIFTILVLIYAMTMRGKPIYEMVSGAYQVTLVAAFVPLVFGLYWKRATTQGAVASIGLGIVSWLALMYSDYAEAFPPQLAGLLFALAGMLLGSLLPQAIKPGAEPARLEHP
ncbi:sodium:solute symporter family protein [soil metagenome]